MKQTKHSDLSEYEQKYNVRYEETTQTWRNKIMDLCGINEPVEEVEEYHERLLRGEDPADVLIDASKYVFSGGIATPPQVRELGGDVLISGEPMDLSLVKQMYNTSDISQEPLDSEAYHEFIDKLTDACEHHAPQRTVTRAEAIEAGFEELHEMGDEIDISPTGEIMARVDAGSGEVINVYYDEQNPVNPVPDGKQDTITLCKMRDTPVEDTRRVMHQLQQDDSTVLFV